MFIDMTFKAVSYSRVEGVSRGFGRQQAECGFGGGFEGTRTVLCTSLIES